MPRERTGRRTYQPMQPLVCATLLSVSLEPASGERIGSFSHGSKRSASRGTKPRFTSPRYIVANRRDMKKRIIPFVKHRDSGIRGAAPPGRQVLVSWRIAPFPQRASRLEIQARRMFLPVGDTIDPLPHDASHMAHATYSSPAYFYTLHR